MANRVQSTILTYAARFTSISSMDGTVTLDSPLRFERTQKQAIRLIKASFTSMIPNIFNYGGTNNGLIKVSRDGGTSWTTIQLPDGVYTVAMINAAINETVISWWASSASTDWGITLEFNLATQKAYTVLDSTKLVAPGTQLAIDYSQSLIYDVLGYPYASSTFSTDGTHDGTNTMNMNYYGDSVSILIDGIGPLTLRNGTQSMELCSVPLSAGTVSNEVVYPFAGIPSPVIQLTKPVQILSSYTISFKGSRTDANGVQYPIYALQGNCEVQIEMMWS